MRFTLLVAALGLAVLTPGIRAQDRDDYSALVTLYAGGSGNDAVAALLRRSKDELTSGARAAAATRPARDLIAAAMLHSEAALSLVDTRLFDATFHVETAQMLLRSAARDAAAHERVEMVTRRWYYFVASVFTSASRMEQADWYIREGLRLYPGDASLYFARGTVAEMTIQIGWQRDLRRELPENTAERTRIETLLKRAGADYQRALSIDPQLAAAHLHLGWIRLFQGDGSARRALEAAAGAHTSRTRYLARLFLGGLAEREKRLDDARREYEAALTEGPGFQTAYLALSRIEEAVGNSRRAQDLAAQCAQLKKDDPDPWWDFVAGFDRDALLDLRTEARGR